jgi:hypothetical protein
MLDGDLARVYGVTVKRLNEQTRRNRGRFPPDFAFQLSTTEWGLLRSQFATLKRGQHRKYRPWVFTEHGALMAANVLRSERAVQMSLYVVRAFVRQREHLAANAAILKRLAEIDRVLLDHDRSLQELWRHLQPLLAPPPDPPHRRIGFHSDEKP